MAKVFVLLVSPARHLKSAEFLDVFRHPTITFHSTGVVSTRDNSYDMTGDLTIRGASAQTHIERRDFGLTWNAVLESGGFVVGEGVDISIDVELIRKPE